MSSESPEQLTDIVVWVDTTLRGQDPGISHPPSNPHTKFPFNKMGSFFEGAAGAIDVAEMERQNMSKAEGEQCALDDFWGLVANQVEQAEATAAMEREDLLSAQIRARIKKEERYRLWEQEDRRKRETRSAVREHLEDHARREYLEIFYNAPSAEMAMNYTWPTRGSLDGTTLGQQSSGSPMGDAEVTWTGRGSNGRGGGGGESPCTTSRGGDDAGTALSAAQSSRDVLNDWNPSSCSSSSAGTGTEGSSTRPFHVFCGKKTHQVFPARDCFVPPRHLSEPTTKHGLISVHALAVAAAAAACPAGREKTAGPETVDPAGANAPSGVSKAVHLPPLLETHGEGWPAAVPSAGRVAATGEPLSSHKRPPSWQRPCSVSSFERKLAARRRQWSREAEEEAEERAFEEQRRTQELLLGVQGIDDGGWQGGGRAGYRYKVGETAAISPGSTQAGRPCHRNGGGVRFARQRRAWSRGWRDRGYHDWGDDEKVTELVPEVEEKLLTEMFGMLDARHRGEVRLDEVLFYMTENAQVKSILKQVPLWMLTKTRRWAWVDELLAAQPGRTLTLPALLAFSRSLHEESHVPRKHLRLATELGEGGVERKDVRSKRLLPADLVEGAEVEALFRKGFERYRAWIVRCHADDTFDVRFTPPPSLCSDEPSPRRGGQEAGEQRPELETSSRFSGSEEDWRSDAENSSLKAEEEEWKATCDSVARFIGIPPDLGETETEVLEKAFDAIVNLVSPTTQAALGSDETDAVGDARGKSGKGIKGLKGITTPTANQPPNPNREDATQQGGLARGRQHEDGGHLERKNGVVGTPDGDAAPRVPAGEIIRLLRAGAIDGYRRASPALSAACIYAEFAEGLEGAAATRGQDREARTANHPIADCCTDEEGDTRGGQRGGRDKGEWGISKEEFCDYFEAVTDLVDLNGLSLVPQVPRGLARPSAVEGG
ncbi:unnamed protein product [Ectocarpus sp. 6 AP-2014]